MRSTNREHRKQYRGQDTTRVQDKDITGQTNKESVKQQKLRHIKEGGKKTRQTYKAPDKQTRGLGRVNGAQTLAIGFGVGVGVRGTSK